MNLESRSQEIADSMTSFRRVQLKKDELLPEMLKLQSEMVRLTFTGSEAETSDLRILDVLKRLEQMNLEKGHPADDSVESFRRECLKFNNLIRAEISGCQGENKVLRRLETLKTLNLTVRNVELASENEKSELDVVVITPKGATIIEVKNTRRDVFIDEEGQFFRVGTYQKLDCNLSEKMILREVLLKTALERAGLANVPVTKLVVFTNNQIEVQNRCSSLQTCFLNQLPYIIDGQKGPSLLNYDEMLLAETALEGYKSQNEYRIGMDISSFKSQFAGLKLRLDSAECPPAESAELTPTEEEVQRPVEMPHVLKTDQPKFTNHKKQQAVTALIETLIKTAAMFALSTGMAKTLKYML